jgi:hypothetical protein
MRNFLPAFLVFFIVHANGQSFTTYTDTINRFSIHIPIGWKYGQNKNLPELKLIAMRTPSSQSDTTNANYNINIIETPNKDLEETFNDFLKYLDAEDLKFIGIGDTILNGIKFKWLIETHKNSNSNILMHNYDLVTLKNGKTYILTMATFSHTFDTMKPLFDKVASSFVIL